MVLSIEYPKELTLSSVTENGCFKLSSGSLAYQAGEKVSGNYKDPYVSMWYGAEASDSTGRALLLSFKVADDAAYGEYTVSAAVSELRVDENGEDLSDKAQINSATVTVTSAFADTEERYLTYTAENGEVTVIGYTGADAKCVIPEKIGGLPVTAIAKGGFAGSNAACVVIPASVEHIAALSFHGCTHITDIYVMGNPVVEDYALGFYTEGVTQSVIEGLTVHGWTDSEINKYATNCSIGFEGLENVYALGYQKSVSSPLAIRFAAEMNYPEYYLAAGLRIEVYEDGSLKTVYDDTINTVYRKLTAVGANGSYDAVAAKDGYAIMARAVYGIPTDKEVRFKITPYVVNPVGCPILGNTVTVVSNNGSVAQA